MYVSVRQHRSAMVAKSCPGLCVGQEDNAWLSQSNGTPPLRPLVTTPNGISFRWNPQAHIALGVRGHFGAPAGYSWPIWPARVKSKWGFRSLVIGHRRPAGFVYGHWRGWKLHGWSRREGVTNHGPLLLDAFSSLFYRPLQGDEDVFMVRLC